MFKIKEVSIRKAAEIATVLGFILVIFTTILSVIQLRELRSSISTQNTISIAEQLSNSVNTNIFAAIDSGSPIRIKNGGHFSDYQVDNYLGLFELLYKVNDDGYIVLGDYCNQFSYYASKSVRNAEIQDYLREIRKEDSGFFVGFEEIANKFNKKCS